MNKNYLKSLPVLMHHLVSNDTSHLSVVPDIFEEQCRSLAEKGWFGIGLKEAEEFLLNGAPLPAKSFLLTFDDGFLDNYVYAWPIMRKYGHKGVIFAVADRISQSQQACAEQNADGANLARYTLEDVWNGKCTKEELPKVDKLLHTSELGFTTRRDLFFNWDEARLMEESGGMSIAGHSTGHESVFSGPAFSTFLQPGDKVRTFINTVPPSFWGMPDFEALPELANRAFIPSPELVEAIKNLVPQRKWGEGGEVQDEPSALNFFKSPEKVAKLKALVEGYKDRLGEYESQQDKISRMRGVMERSQKVLSHELGHKIRSFCWPWGNFCEEAREQGQAAGFEVFYTTKPGINRPGRPLAVHRFKVKNRADSWLLGRLCLYSRPLLGALYLKMRL